MSLLVDTSAWYAAADSLDRSSARAKSVLSAPGRMVTTDHVLIETWVLLRNRIHRNAAERFWYALKSGAAIIELVGTADLEVAWTIGQSFPDQDFSIVDRTSFAVMQRLGIRRVVTFGNDLSGKCAPRSNSCAENDLAGSDQRQSNRTPPSPLWRVNDAFNGPPLSGSLPIAGFIRHAIIRGSDFNVKAKRPIPRGQASLDQWEFGAA